MADASRVLEVNVLGTDHVLAAHLELSGPGTVAVVIASSAAHIAAIYGMITTEQEVRLADAATDELLDLIGAIDHSAVAYSIAKRVNLLRVERAALDWGRRGARVVSVSPGTMATPMGHLELSEAPGVEIRRQLEASPVPRIGTPQDIAAAVEWLAGPAASFVTGCDLRVDGGTTAEVKARVARQS
jgi:NAD(P)-dependent dehydrogenase (short-subunit alcohol dehydrogenase family)